ncbi:MAG TPA: family 16 glycoside hydrolase, partial [Verrucomicrobiae bacterium]|nr:family 16 glycoside hydrolase [Verrucomicrobiae bacterium]
VYKPTEWNKYRIMLKGPKVEVELNGEKILNVNLDEELKTVKRHDGSDALPLKDRPRKGHIGFQNLSQGDAPVEIRNARIKELQ